VELWIPGDEGCGVNLVETFGSCGLRQGGNGELGIGVFLSFGILYVIALLFGQPSIAGVYGIRDGIGCSDEELRDLTHQAA